jgi:hypothetical protein
MYCKVKEDMTEVAGASDDRISGTQKQRRAGHSLKTSEENPRTRSLDVERIRSSPLSPRPIPAQLLTHSEMGYYLMQRKRVRRARSAEEGARQVSAERPPRSSALSSLPRNPPPNLLLSASRSQPRTHTHCRKKLLAQRWAGNPNCSGPVCPSTGPCPRAASPLPRRASPPKPSISIRWCAAEFVWEGGRSDRGLAKEQGASECWQQVRATPNLSSFAPFRRALSPALSQACSEGGAGANYNEKADESENDRHARTHGRTR